MELLSPVLLVVVGIVILVWGADKFVTASSAFAKHFNVPSLLVGMIIVGFGTSAPEFIVSAMGALNGQPGICIGNAFGSNIANIALILGVTAMISPVSVNWSILKFELPVLTLATVFVAFLIRDGNLSRLDALLMLIVFFAIIGYQIKTALKEKKLADEAVKTDDASLASEHTESEEGETSQSQVEMSLGKSVFWIFAGLLLLMVSARMLVSGATDIAKIFGISDLVIGLTVVALGTSLPELASSVVAARKKEDDIAVGNIVGSSIFNLLAVVGFAGMIAPFKAEKIVLTRDVPAMLIVTLALFLSYFTKGEQKRISRLGGSLLLLSYIAYTVYLFVGKAG
ncbi:MAG: calcium/sodium antiporter [Candidatus Riflebacteria bacterium]|nr:calcium/sodium antiporter [Candidatus Riflebacteria bacterium]